MIAFSIITCTVIEVLMQTIAKLFAFLTHLCICASYLDSLLSNSEPLCIFLYFWIYVCLYVIFQSLFSFFKIPRFPLTLSISMYTKLFCIITHFTIMIWLITKILLAISISQLASNVFTIYPPFVRNNDITCRVIMFP